MYPTFLCGREYWILRTIQSPIPDTMMNKAQIVANCRFLEDKIVEQASTIKSMEEKLDSIQRVVYQLLGGLFNQDSQDGTLSRHLNTLFNQTISQADEEDTSKWTIWPTTRQGDENADRIAALEAHIHEMKNDTDSVSTHSSMPDLIAVNESESDDELPDFVEAIFASYSDSDNDSDSSMPDLVDVEEETIEVEEDRDNRINMLLRSQELGWGAKHFIGWF
jgi:hypothetical protein